MSGTMWVEVVFMLVILKIPIVYLCLVVWWAIKAEPRPPEPALLSVAAEPEPRPPWRPIRPPRTRDRPHGSPARGPLRPRRAAVAS